MLDIEKLKTISREELEKHKQDAPKVQKVDVSHYFKPTPKNKFNEFLKNVLILIVFGIFCIIASCSNDNSIARYEGPTKGLHR